MFKSWRSDRNKIKAVFKLQFQASQVPKLKKPALIISLVPDDVGKPTFKLEKAAIQDGTCSWENPIYVSVKLIREPKTGKIHEKIYHFVVATGSSKSGFLGEASIDFADFVAEIRPVIVSLPLKFANSGAVLHVTIEKITGDERLNEETGYPGLLKDESFDSLPIDNDVDRYDQDLAVDQLKGSMRSDMSGRNNDSDSKRHPPNRQNSIPHQREGNLNTKRNGHKRSNTDWSMSSASDGSLVELRNSPENNFQARQAEYSNHSDDKHKAEITNLLRQAEMSDLEMQSLRKQIAKESKRVQDLSEELKFVSDERDELYTECEQLKLQKHIDDNYAEKRLQSVSEDSSSMIEEIKEELNHEKKSNENLRLQLQRTEESNSNLILAVRDLNDMLEKKNEQIASLTIKKEEEIASHVNSNGDYHLEEIAYLKKTLADMNNRVESCAKQKEELEVQIKRLSQENERVKEEKLEISSKLDQQDQMVQQKDDSKHVIKNLETQIEILEDRIKHQSEEYSESLITINELETNVRKLKKELEEQGQAFEADIESMIQAKTDLEQRAIQAEADLRKTRSKNTVAAERLQEKCKRLSMEMKSKLEESESQMKIITAEADALRLEKKNLEEILQQANKELRQIHDEHECRLEELSNQLESRKKDAEELQRELHDKSKQLELNEKEGEEKQKTLTAEIEMLRHELKNVKLRNDSSAQTKEPNVSSQKWMVEKVDLEKKIALARDEMEKLQAQLSAVRSAKNEKETTIKNMKKEVENINLRYKELQNSLNNEQREKETLKKQVSKLKADLQRKEDGISMKPFVRTGDSGAKKEQKVSANKSHEEANVAKLREELTHVKDRNKSMEKELKDMEERYSEISLKFAEVEGERQQLVMVVRNLKNGKKP